MDPACPPSPAAVAASDSDTGGAVDISAINGIPIAGHQGAGSITDSTIRTLLTLRGEFVPNQIVSLMHYPDAAEHARHARRTANAIQIDFQPPAAATRAEPGRGRQGGAHSAARRPDGARRRSWRAAR